MNPFIAHEGIYMLSHSVGLPLVGAEQAAASAFWQPWQRGDAEIWNHWLGEITRFREQLAMLMNTEMANICPQSSLSSAVSKIVFSLPTRPQRPVILLSEEDFPSIAFALQKTASLGYQLKFISTDTDISDLAQWDQQMTSDVGMVLVTHVQSNNGRQLPVQKITELARQKGVLSLVDVAQSAAIIPIDLQQWQADFVVGSSVKWIGGGPGAAFLWVDPEIIDQCQPDNVGWFSHENPFEFDIHQFRYASDALRFWGGTPSVYPYALAANSLTQINAMGVDKIRQNNIALSEMIIQAVPHSALISPRLDAQRSGTLILNFGQFQQQVVSCLNESKVHFDTRVKGIRLSPHGCNTAAQIEAIIGCF
ncbi:aminotransferase class V-fold PLP-dependent enzyme [SAR92 clade bacterium H455]|uniref:Aminotransferase class V-fold PLP-dependent enzyme n=1 Tax=SAR92 clade bacterium H455 TaxID=2974818 RepID=A0ABY5TIU1_9GAMM|nr:aminotransferase class V-fold PLP-dependent enzyme [SAR92 clade bacterium H455]